ncbi:MAG TPA: HAMP domain-containing sensor histidine kinase [Acidimicrobiia bacterium]|nr:HAMP domain-containing sensor histidine kinase [Acidimicrobiia bacterium]
MLAVSASVVLVFFLGGLAFTNSVGAARVADNARDLHWVNTTLGTAALTRAGLVQATNLVGLEADGDDVVYAIEQVEFSYDELEELRASGSGRRSTPLLSGFLVSANKVLAALRSGDHETAKALLVDDVEVSYGELAESLETEQGEVLGAIERNTEASNRLNDYVLFLLLLVVPGSAVVVYWLVARRQLREHRLKTEVELEAEREIGRAKDHFIAGLSHELRTPLTSIYGFAEVLADGGVDDREQVGDTAQVIANEAAEMTRMIDDLLVASRMESTGVTVELSPTAVDDVLEAAITPFERAGREIRRERSDAVVSADPRRLRQVLTNLLSNAARHGGPSIGVEITAGEDIVEIHVWDDGSGVSEDQIERLFERYVHSGKAALLTGSVGLGLAVASRLTELMGGSLSYRPDENKTCFTVRLAVHPVDEDTTETAIPSISEAVSR